MAAKDSFLDLRLITAKTAEILKYDSWINLKKIVFWCFGQKFKMLKILQLALESLELFEFFRCTLVASNGFSHPAVFRKGLLKCN
jgi:hypothetical protein